jgi:pimeloyl-ACP methyl ester carboxylesterase
MVRGIAGDTGASLTWRIRSGLVLSTCIVLLAACGLPALMSRTLNVCVPPQPGASKWFLRGDDVPSRQLIVFVHGLCGDATTTWQSPELYLPQAIYEDIPDTDVLVFSYDSSLFSGTSIVRIVAQLQAEIQDAQRRRVYVTLKFVAHSLGGIVARQYILDRPLPQVSRLVLLASPSLGSDFADQFGYLVPDSALATNLRSSELNDYIATLNEQWESRESPAGFSVYAAFEQRPMAGQRSVIVSRGSATYQVRTGNQRSVDTDHVGVAKPNGRDQYYGWIKTRLDLPAAFDSTVIQAFKKQGTLTVAEVQDSDGLSRTIGTGEESRRQQRVDAAMARADELAAPRTQTDAVERLGNRFERIRPLLAKRLRILWVDDRPEDNKFERDLMKQLGMDVSPVISTAEALNALRLHDPSYAVVISDMDRREQPRVDGCRIRDRSRPECLGDGERLVRSMRTQGLCVPVVFYFRNIDWEEGAPPHAIGSTDRPDELVHMVFDALERGPYASFCTAR